MIYFDLKLEDEPNVLLSRYEDLVSNALPSFSRIFEFIGCDLSPDYVANVSSSSVGKRDKPTLSPEIDELGAGLLARMDDQYRAQHPPQGVGSAGRSTELGR